MFLQLIFFMCLPLALAHCLATADSSDCRARKLSSWLSAGTVHTIRCENGVKKSTENNLKNLETQSVYTAVTHSCIDRCHVSYLTYENPYQKRVFRHRIHSPGQGFDCVLCHVNDAFGLETHGKLIVQDKDCLTCHHKNKDVEDCWRCHTGIQEYREGTIEGFNVKVPDIMVRDVSCTGCHQLTYDGAAFKPVRENCIECHNSSESYGKIYDIWKEILHNADVLCEGKETYSIPINQRTMYYPGTHPVLQMIMATSQILARDIPKLYSAGEKYPAKSLQKKTYSPVNFRNRQELLQFIRSNGMHNIILSQLLLRYIQTKQ